MKNNIVDLRSTIAILALLLASLGAVPGSSAQDTTKVSIHAETAYSGLLYRVPVSLTWQSPTSSVQGRLRFDSSRLHFIGIDPGAGLSPEVQSIAFHHYAPDSVSFAMAWAVAVSARDSLFTVKFLPVQNGTARFSFLHWRFDDRVPANDGVNFSPAQTEVYPLDQFPGFVVDGPSPQDSLYIERSTACNTIDNFYLLRSTSGDVSGNGTLSALDAALILRRVVGIDYALPVDTMRVVLPSFCQ